MRECIICVSHAAGWLSLTDGWVCLQCTLYTAAVAGLQTCADLTAGALTAHSTVLPTERAELDNRTILRVNASLRHLHEGVV